MQAQLKYPIVCLQFVFEQNQKLEPRYLSPPHEVKTMSSIENNEAKKNSVNKFSFTQVLRFAASYWKLQPALLSFIIFLVLISALLETFQPNALSLFLGAVREHKDHATILYYLIVFLAVYTGQALLTSIAYIFYNSFETTLFKQLVDDVFTHIYRLPEQFFSNTFTGSIISKVNRARQKIETFQDQILLRFFTTFLILMGSIIFLAFQFPVLALLMIFYLAFLIWMSAFLVFRLSGPAQAEYAAEQDHFAAHLADSVSGIATTKSYALESFECQRVAAITEGLRAKNLRAYQLGNIAASIQRLLLAGMLALMLGGGVWYYFQGKTTVESLAYLAFAYTIMQSYIRDIGENVKYLLTAAYDLHGVIGLLHEKPEVPRESKLPAINIKEGRILFDDIEFCYPDKTIPLFQHLTVSIKAGERIALVGHSGGGKTSFIRLIQALYSFQNGRIIIDDQDITQFSPQSLRSNIALVPQDPILFHRSIRDNIIYAKPNASDAEIRSAARQARIEEFILSQPLQYETLVGERGIKLSGGERQRLAIARAILADRPILILDEATSSLDSESERAIQDALHTLTAGRTSIMIAHRLSTIQDADRILVFEHGTIVEQGSHTDLVGIENGIYAKLFKLQSGGFIPE